MRMHVPINILCFSIIKEALGLRVFFFDNADVEKANENLLCAAVIDVNGICICRILHDT